MGQVVRALRALRDDDGQLLIDDVVVCDNGSDDETATVAQAAGARVVYEPQRGYGRACLAGINTLHPVGCVLSLLGHLNNVSETASFGPTAEDSTKIVTTIRLGVRVAVAA